jgi:hypothetical protein
MRHRLRGQAPGVQLLVQRRQAQGEPELVHEQVESQQRRRFPLRANLFSRYFAGVSFSIFPIHAPN